MDKPVSYVTAGEIARKKKKEKKMTSGAETVPVLNVEACDHFSEICQKYVIFFLQTLILSPVNIIDNDYND